MTQIIVVNVDFEQYCSAVIAYINRVWQLTITYPPVANFL